MPVDDAIAHAAKDPLVMTFSEDVQAGVTPIVIFRASDDELFEAIDGDSPQVQYSGNTATVSPSPGRSGRPDERRESKGLPTVR